ncbi:MAG: MFS transporter [Candidatus Hodarchaeales archaeon]
MSFRNMVLSGKSSHLFIATLPSSYFWIAGTFFFLIKGFQLIEYAKEQALLTGFLGTTALGDLLIGVFYATPPLLAIGLVGQLIDNRPYLLGKITLISLVISSSALFLFVIALKLLIAPITLSLVTVFLTGLACLATASHTTYGAVTKWSHRGRGFAVGNLIFGITIVGLLLICGYFKLDFFFSLFIISILGFVISIMFYYTTREWVYWQNDEWPTKTSQILVRQSVRAYFFSHILIYFMLGLTIGSLAQEGVKENYSRFLGIELGAFETFWAILVLGTVIFVIPAGILSDKIGRKDLTIMATYGIVLASLIASLHGLIDQNFDSMVYVLTAFTIGVSFAFLHPTLDSSLWIDLSSKDSIGRYCDINVYSLVTGLAAGFGISYFFLSTLIEYRNIMVLMYIGLAVLAVLPLFWVSDSFPPLEFFLLLVINDAGVPIFHYSFGRKKELQIDLPLISGALSAVGSFMLEATGETGAKLNLVRHGTHFILSDQSSDIGLTATIFANKNDPELQIILSKFLRRFRKRFSKELSEWKGDILAFEAAIEDAEEIFGPLITIATDDPMITTSKNPS